MGLKDSKENNDVMSLEQFKKFVIKVSGKDSIINASEKENYGDVIPCTSFSLRQALGIGGFAKRKLYTIDGDLSSGKSTTGYDIIAQCQKVYKQRCLLIDREDAYTTEYGALLGIDNDLIDIITPNNLEEMYDILQVALRSNLYGVILVDSVTAFAPETRFEGSVVMGVEARVNSDKMRLIVHALNQSDTCLIMIQQTRQKIGVMGGDPTTVSGGTAIPFYAHVRIRITRSQIDRENMQNVMKFTIIKNKMAPPFKVGTVVYKWGEGFDFSSEIAQLAVEFGVIKNEGKSYYFPNLDDFKLVGKKKVIDYLNDNPEYTKQIIEPMVLEVLNNSEQLRTEEIDENELY